MAYTAKTWVTGEVIQAVDLNHAENGIAEADAKATAISAPGAIGTANLADGAVTNNKLDQEAVDSNNIRTGAILTPLIYDGAVTGDKLADGAVSYAKLDAALKGKVDAFDALGLSVVDGMLCVTYSE